ncbi:FadR/GntR family transcriptional regulator [Paenibacillus arenilitoris]|uniref:FadR family transcriptional regulator n=1 Tax=Paenibacillus arenilitoris TaxID=2772299 RepID=A0A927CGC5_9BACL|nr:FadR/GntR family transcriptional regulator [Paenibacillus arenilitoris]MBD2867045.1 FadR family transcriptional regulator [Paenibacillus arenilitoris]
MKITTPKGHELVADQILLKIKDGAWQPGERIPSVVELAEAFGVGRSTVREAVSALKAMGWLDVRHGGGTFVKPVLPAEGHRDERLLLQGADSLVELLEVRMALEVRAASLAAERRSPEDLQRLTEWLAAMEIGLGRNDTSEGERADVAFHMAIAAASGNSLLFQLMESLSGRFNESIRQSRELWFYREKATAARLLHEHRMIFEAIEKQDKKLAESRIADHLSKVEQVLRDALQH